jgi:hypothetical protein
MRQVVLFHERIISLLPLGGIMKKSLFAGVALLGLSMFAGYSYGADEKFTGVLIDQKCGAGKNETAAAKHPASCCIKCSKAGFELITGDTHLKLDDASAAKAKEYLEKDKASTKVTIEGTKDGETLKVTSIEAAK